MSEKRIAYMSFIWNAIYAGFNAVQSSVILLAIARNKELSEAGIITIGFTVATLIMIIARYGIRNYQVTDAKEEYSFSDYFYVRIITVGGSLALALIYLFGMLAVGRYSSYRALVGFGIIILKLVDAFEGLYVGRFQQKGRLDVGAKIATVRIIASTAVIFCLTWFVESVPVCFFAGIIVSVLIDLLLIPRGRKYADLSVRKEIGARIKPLLITALPLCIGTALHNYIGNAPKYLVDFFLTDEIQAISGYIMMPMFVITVLNAFLMQPTVKSLGDAWHSGDKQKLKKMITRHIVLISVAAIGVLILGIFVGLPLLSWMYKVALVQYRTEFILIMIGGTIYTISAYAIVLLTAMRRQKWIVIGCLISVATYTLFGKLAVGTGGLAGAATIYIVSNVVLLSLFVFGMCSRQNRQIIKE